MLSREVQNGLKERAVVIETLRRSLLKDIAQLEKEAAAIAVLLGTDSPSPPAEMVTVGPALHGKIMTAVRAASFAERIRVAMQALQRARPSEVASYLEARGENMKGPALVSAVNTELHRMSKSPNLPINGSGDGYYEYKEKAKVLFAKQ